MSDALPGSSGGQVARLDELAAITREYATTSRDAVSLPAWLALLAWMVICVAVNRASAPWGLVACAAQVAVAVGVLALDQRKGWALRGGAVKWRPEDRLEEVLFRRPGGFGGWVCLAYSLAMLVVTGMARQVQLSSQPLTVLLSGMAVLALDAWAVWYAIARDRRPMQTQLAFLYPGILASTYAWLATWIVPFAIGVPVVWVGGWVLHRAGLRRRLERLERRIAFLKEHAR
jgi:hypothetical protein